MDESSTKLIHYGHFGKATYHSKAQSWGFSRTIVPPPRLSYTGVTKVAVQSPSVQTAHSAISKRSTLTRAYPELIGGYRLARHETLSHTISATSEACNPLVSSLLDFGRAVDSDVDNSGRRAVPIVAFASGESGSIISFRKITDDTADLEHDTSAQLRVPTIENEGGINWSAQGAPIQQICFSHAPEERATLMAVRFSSTMIFRPLYRRVPVSVSVDRGINGTALGYQVSRMDPNFLMEISTSHTGGFAHADAKFNPWNQYQLALVDQGGHWGIWELRNQPKRKKDNWIAAVVRSGILPSVDVEKAQTGTDGRYDGWLAIEWVGNESCIVVCDRRCSTLYRMEGDRAYTYEMKLAFRRDSEWILGSIPVYEGTGPSLYPRLSWRHFRDPDDTTLQLSSITANEDFYLVLFSRLSPLALAYYCSETREVENGSLSVPDPLILHLPASCDNAGNTEALSSDTHLTSLVFKEFAPAATREQDIDSSVSLIKAFMIDSSLRIRESVYSKPLDGDLGGERSRGRDLLRVRQLRLTGLQNRAEYPLSGFIVDDWDEHAHGNGPVSDHGIANIAPTAEPYFTLDYEQIYDIATGALDLLLQDGEKTIERNFQESIDELVAKVTDHISSEEPTSWTALEILRKSLVLDDIDQNSHDLAASVAQFAANHSALGDRDHLLVQRYESFSLQSAQQLDAAETTKLDLVSRYDQLVNDWLIDLPADTPGRARIMKEKSIRHFVADIVLSQIIAVHRSAETESIAKGSEGRSASTSGLMDLEQLMPNKTMTESDDHGLHSQAAVPATRSSSALEDPGPSHEHSVNERPTFSVLSSYTTFSRTESTSRDAKRILDHWKPGVDPASYSLISEESQSAALNRASRRKYRKKVSQAMKSLSLDTPQPPSVSTPAIAVRGDWGSQPDNSQPPMIHLPSSQVTNDLPMTQVERGAFGGREASKKSGIKARKKKRAAGF